MAAAGLAGSNAGNGVATTKGFFVIFSLLCLVCLSSSLIDEEQLVE